MVPSIATRTFREPWGLVVNEAMNRRLPVIASDAVGAAAGGLVRDGRNGLVVPAGDRRALAGALRRLAADAPLRARLGAAGAADVRAYTYEAWAAGFSDALATLGLSSGGAGSVHHLPTMTVRPRTHTRPPRTCTRLPRRRGHVRAAPAVAVALALALVAAAPAAAASETTKILEECAAGTLLTGYSQQAYNQALKELPPELAESTPTAPT